MDAKTRFENLPLGPINTLPLNAPPGAMAGWIGPMEIIETPKVAQDSGPGRPGWGTKCLRLLGPVQVFCGGAVRKLGFSGSNRTPGTNPRQAMHVLTAAGQFAPQATLEFLLDGQVLPAFGNSSLQVNGAYGFGAVNCDVVGEISVGDGQP